MNINYKNKISIAILSILFVGVFGASQEVFGGVDMEDESQVNTYICEDEEIDFEDNLCWNLGAPGMPVSEPIILPGTHTITGNLNIGNGGEVKVTGSLTVSEDVNIDEGGTFNVVGSGDVQGNVNNLSGETVIVIGSLTVFGLNNFVGDTVIINPGGILSSIFLVNYGDIVINPGGTLDNLAGMMNMPGASIINSGTIVSPSLSNQNGANLINNGSIQICSGMGCLLFNEGTFDNNGSISGSLIDNEVLGSISLGCESSLAVDEINNDGIITSPVPVTVPIFTGNPIVIQGTCSTGGGSGDYHTGPTFGKDDLGNQQVQNGLKLFKGPELVQQFTLEQFHTEALIEAEPNTSYTFVLEVYSPLGGDAIDEVKIFTAPRTFNQNEKIWEIRIIQDLSQPNGYRLDVTDPEGKLTDPITFTVQNVGSHKIVTITVGGFEITGDAEAIGLWARDTLGYTTISWVNDGLKIADVFSYPALLTGFEGLLSGPKVCTEQEDPDNRYSCAFEEKKNAELAKAQKVYNEITKNLAQAQVEKYAILDTEYKITEIESKLVYGPQLQDKMHLITIE